MLTDSSSSELNYSPIARRKSKRYQVTSSGDSSDDDTPIKRPVRGIRSRIPSSSSSSSGSDRPKKKRIRRAGPDSESSDSYESDSPIRGRLTRRGTLLSSSDSYSSEVETALGTDTLPKSPKNDESSSDSDGGEQCIICFKSLQPPVARPSACSHSFHEHCLATWSKTSNTCPIDRVKYNSINIVNSDGKVLSIQNVSTPSPCHHSDFEPDNPTFCEVCHFHDREEVMLLCDRCDAGYHIDCLDPPLENVPLDQWFCPSCEQTSIEDSEVLELLADNVLLDNRLRNRSSRSSRVNPRLHLSRRAVQAAFNLVNNASSRASSHLNEEPSTSTGRRGSSAKRPRSSRKSSRKKRTTKYKVELVTTEDGTTVEVKLAIQSRRSRKKKKTSKSSSRRNEGRCNNENSSNSNRGPQSNYHPAPLDLFGSRPTLDYFSGCEAEDEEELGGEVGLLRAGHNAVASRSGLISRKGIASVLANSSSTPRPRVNIEAPVNSVNLLDDILRDQEIWHRPGSVNISSTSNGAVKVTLPKDGSGCSTRESAIHGGRGDGRGGGRYGGGRYNGGRYSGGRYSGGPSSRGGQMGSRGGRGNSSCGHGGSTSSAGPSSGNFHQNRSPYSSIQPIPAPPIPPLVPPPEPPLRLVEDDDLDIYGDIEPPPTMAKLVPPPEPPAMLLALDNQPADEGASSPDEGLVIDDQRDTYDPDQPNSPSSGNRTDEEDSAEGRTVELPDIPLPAQGIRLEDIKLPSPSRNDDDDDDDDDDSDSEVPITEHYSKASLKIAQNVSDNSSVSSEEDGQYIDDIIERFKKAPPLKVGLPEPSSIVTVEKKVQQQSDLEIQSPVKEKLRKYAEESACHSDESSIETSTLEKKTQRNSAPVDQPENVLEEVAKVACSRDGTPVRDEKDVLENEEETAPERVANVKDTSNDSESAKSNIRAKKDDGLDLGDSHVITDAKKKVEEGNLDIGSKDKGTKTSEKKDGLNEEMEFDQDPLDESFTSTNRESENESSVQVSDASQVDENERNPITDSNTFDASFQALSPKPQRRRRSTAKSVEADNAQLDDSGKIISETRREGGTDQDGHLMDKSPSYHDDNYLSPDESKSIDGDQNELHLHNGHKSQSLSSGEVQSDASESQDNISEPSISSDRRSSRKRKLSNDDDDDDDDDDEFEIGLNESVASGVADDGDKDGLVEITDEEISSYEKNWEMEENGKLIKQSGLEGLETEAISECEDALCEDAAPVAQVKTSTETYLSKEEGEIITDDRNEFIPWKRVTKSTKDRSYREKEKNKEKDKEKTPEKKKKEKKPKEKRKDLERYDIRKVIGDKRKKDEFGRDIASSQSRSVSRESGIVRSEVRRVRDWSKTRKRSRARSLSRSRNRDRSTSRSKRRRSRGRSLDRNRNKGNYVRDKERKRSRGRSKTRRDQSRDRKKTQSGKSGDKKKAVDKSSERRDRSGGKDKSRDDRDKRAVSSSSCSTCSCSSCERERLATNKLTVSVPSAPTTSKKSKDKKKDKSRKTGKKDNKRRRTESPLPSKEVFTSGDNILVSVNFKSSSKTSGEPRRGGSRRVWEEESRKKKDKENQPVRSVVPILAATQEKDKRRQRRRMASNAKPVAIIDLDPSPFREEAVSPTEVIILTDESDNETGGKQGDAIHQSTTTGPKTPPEPPVKFTISSKPQLRSLSNPLEEVDEEGDRDDDDDDDDDDREEPMVMHKGPNTPPEPPETYDPFEPTKSNSPSPRRDNIRGSSSADNQIVNNNEVLSDGKPQPSPQPKIQETVVLEKPSFMIEADVDFCLGGDSPYSPASSEADDLFDPPTVTPTRAKPLRPLGSLPLPPTPLLPANKAKLTPSPTKRRQQPSTRLTPVPRKAAPSKKEIGIRLDENQLKILDELPSSAVEMQVKDKFLKKLNRQERVVEEVKFVLKPHYNKKHVTKEEYKEILRKAVPKICHSKSGEINPFKIQKLIEAYVKKYRHKRKKTGPPPPGGVVKPKAAKVLPPILKTMLGNLGMRSQDTLNNRNAPNKTL